MARQMHVEVKTGPVTARYIDYDVPVAYQTDEDIKQYLEKTWGVKVVRVYGLSEDFKTEYLDNEPLLVKLRLERVLKEALLTEGCGIAIITNKLDENFGKIVASLDGYTTVIEIGIPTEIE